MPAWVWIAANVLVGLPLALFAIVAAREAIRAGLGLALGFRVFEVQWGAGPRGFERPIGPVDVRLAPLAARRRGGRARRQSEGATASVASCWRSGHSSPRPAGWSVARSPGHRPAPRRSSRGPAPWACLDLVNTLVLIGHATIAVELSEGVRTDVRLLLDALLARADGERAARANYYARLVRHRLERADVDGASEALAQGTTQLGPEPLLVACREILAATDLDSVVDQGAACDRLEAEIEAAEPRRHVERAAWSTGERLRQTLFSATPITLALLALAFVQADGRRAGPSSAACWPSVTSSPSAAAPRRVARCSSAGRAWSDRLDPWLPPSPERTQRSPLGALAARDVSRRRSRRAGPAERGADRDERRPARGRGHDHERSPAMVRLRAAHDAAAAGDGDGGPGAARVSRGAADAGPGGAAPGAPWTARCGRSVPSPSMRT